MKLLFNSFLIILLSLSQSNAQNEGQACYTRQNIQGVCTSFYYCQFAREQYERGIYPTLCQSQRTDLVCCATSNDGGGGGGNSDRTGSGNRLSERKCQEYSKMTKEVTSFAGLSLGSSNKNRQDVESNKCVLSTSLVVGGEKAKTGEFPHMAVLAARTIDGFAFFCGGSLISERFVLTAAHCEFYQRKTADIVRLGDQNIKTKTDGVNEIDVPVEKFIRHENYRSQTKKNDIAVVKLRYNVNFSDNIRPACIWLSNNVGQKAVAIGYGATGFAEANSDELLKVSLPIQNINECEGVDRLDNTQICAGGTEGKDTCQGDSGGPLQIQGSNNKCIFHIIGITSYGTQACGYTPAVYTRVSSYVDWIEGKVWQS